MKRLLVYLWILNLLTGCNRPEQKVTKYSTPFSSKDGQVYYDDKPIPADAATFECIKYEYSKDKDHIYFGPTLMKEIDVNSFQVLEHGYSKDKNYVFYGYYSGNKIIGADASSFQLFDVAVSKDKSSVYYYDLTAVVKLPNTDALTFRQLCNSYYVDKNNLYLCTGEIAKDIRGLTIIQVRELAGCMAIDNNH